MVLRRRRGGTWAEVGRPRRRFRTGAVAAAVAVLASQGGILASVLSAKAASAATTATSAPASYEVDTSTGVVFSFSAGSFTSSPGLSLNKPMVGIAGTTDGHGYWQVAGDGGVFATPDAQFHGSQADTTLAKPVVGMTGTSDNGGYWLAAGDGGVFADPNATFHGSMAGRTLNAPVVGIAAMPTGGGYWLAAGDGGVFNLGNAPFFGSAVPNRPSSAVVGIAATPTGGGYWLTTASGQIFRFGNAGTYGSLTGFTINAPIVAISATSDGHGFWLVGADGGIYAFGDAPYLGSLPGEGVALSNIVGITGHGSGTPAPPPPTTPTLTKITPSAGKTSGGTRVTLLGTGFVAGATVAFGTVGATTVTVESGTQITAKAPAQAAGTVTVTVTTPNGTSNPLPYTYDTAPTLTGITPEGGPSGGGTTVHLTGTHFVTGATVAFGTKQGTTIHVVSTSKITVKAPSHTAGTVNVTVTTPGGTTGALKYDYLPVPALTLVTPSAGKTAGGTVITLTGSNFLGGATVAFGTSPGTTVTVVSSHEITVKAPGPGAGTVTVSVTDSGGTSNKLPYTYDAPPTLITVNPKAGTTTGGTQVDLFGSNFVAGSKVHFGATPGTTVTVVSTDEITLKTPPHSPGTVTVTVITPGGTSNGKPYTFDVAPALTKVTPSAGKTAGGTVITLTGSGFVATATVKFGTTAGGTVTVVSGTTITVKAPAHTAGTVNVTVTTSGGTSDAKTYTYDAVPTLTKVTPSAGKTTGGTLVTLTGTGFNATSVVTFGGTAPTSFTVVSTTEIQLSTATHVAGTVTVTVTTPGGTSNAKTYRYEAAPHLTSLTPTSGETTGGTFVALHGHHFTETATVTIGGTEVPLATFTSPTLVHIVTPAHTAGTVTVTIATPGGTSNELTFEYVVPTPVLTSISPTEGSATGGITATLGGSHLTSVTSVTFGGKPATFTIDGPASITVTVPSGTPTTTVTVFVTSPGGTSNSVTFHYTFPKPHLTSVTPTTGPATGGNSVTLHGSGLGYVTEVTFGGHLATFTINGPTSITVNTVPSGTPTTTVTVFVTSPGGTSNTVTYHYKFFTADLTSLTPTFGPSPGGTQILIFGTHLSHVTEVHFGTTVIGTSTFTVLSTTELAVDSPPGTPTTTVTVWVTSTTGTSNSLVFQYTYPQPQLTFATPPSGIATGGYTITLFGDNLTYVTSVTIGGKTATFTINGSTSITVTTVPSGTPTTTVTMSVTSPGGSSNSINFQYVYPHPHLTSITPTSGPATGGNSVTLHGSGLTFVTSVNFGGTTATFTVTGPTSITVYTVPSGTPTTTVTVFVTSPGGTSNTVAYQYQFFAPHLIFITPDHDVSIGGATVIIVGSHLTRVTAVHFGTNTATFFVLATTAIIANVPAGTPRTTVTVWVTSTTGTSNTVTFHYTGSLTQTTPTSGTVSVTTSGTFSVGLEVSNGTGTVFFTLTGGDTGDFTLTSTGFLFTTTTLPTGVYCVTGTDHDTAGDTGTWSFCLTVFTPHNLTQATPTSGTVSTTTAGAFSSQLEVSNATGTVTFTATGGTTGDLTVLSTGEISTSGTLPAGFYCVTGTDNDTHSDTGTWSFCLTVLAHNLTQTAPFGALVSTTTSGSFSTQLKALNAVGTVTFTESGGTTGDISVFTTGSLFTTATLPTGFYCVTGTDHDTSGDTGTWSFCLTVFSTIHNLTQTTPEFRTVSTTTAGTFSTHLDVSNATGTVTFTETGGTTGDLFVFTTGAVFTTGDLPAGLYCVTGTDQDTHGDTGTWFFCLTVFSHNLTQATPTFGTVSTSTAGSFSSQLEVSNAVGTVTFTVSGGTTGDFSVFTTGDLFTTATLPTGFYCVTGTDHDTSGDTGTWSFCLTVFSHPLTQTTPIFATVSATTSGSFSTRLEVSGAVGTVTFTVTGGTTEDFVVFTTGFFFTSGTLPTGFYCVNGTDHDASADTGTWSFCLTVFSTTHNLTQAAPTFGTVSTSTAGTFSSHLEVSNATGTVTYTATGGTEADFSVFTTGAIFTTGDLPTGFYCVTGTDQDTHGDTGTWSFCLTVFAHNLTQTTPTSATVPTTTSGTFSSNLEVSGAVGTVTFTVTGGTTGDFTVFTTGFFFTNTTLPTGFYCVSGTDHDTSGDNGSWSFCLTVFST